MAVDNTNTPEVQPLESLGSASSVANTGQLTTPIENDYLPVTISQPFRQFSKRLVWLLVVAGVLVLAAVGGTLVYTHVHSSSGRVSFSGPAGKVVEQVVEPRQAISDVPIGQGGTLTVNSDLQVNGQLQVLDASGRLTTIMASPIGGDSAIVLPSGNGTLCLSNNNCNFVTPPQLTAGLAGVIVPPASLVNGVVGKLTLQGTPGQITVLTANGIVTLGAPQDLADTSSPTFAGLLVSNNLAVAGNVSVANTLTLSALSCSTYAQGGKLTTDANGQVVCANDAAGAGGVAGTGTQNYLSKFNNAGGTAIGNSGIYDDGTFVGIGTTTNNGFVSIQGGVAIQPSLSVSSMAGNAVAVFQGGNVGIGTATPQAALDVYGSAVTHTGTGTISSPGGTPVVTGVGTHFTTELHTGDVVTAAGQTQVVAAVQSDTQFTTTFNIFSPGVTNASFTYVEPSQRITSATNNIGLTIQASAGATYYPLAVFNNGGGYVFTITAGGTVLAGGALQSNPGLFKGADSSLISNNTSLKSGAGGTGSGSVTLQSGGTTTGNSGNAYVDVGTTGSGTTGSVNIGTTNASTIIIGHSGATVSSLSPIYVPALSAPAGGGAATINLNNTGTVITRNVADNSPVLTVQNLNASSTGDILDLINRLGNKVITVDSNGQMDNVGRITAGAYNHTIGGGAVLASNTEFATNIGIVSRGVAGQTADLFQLQAANANVLSGFNAGGSLYFANGGFTNTLGSVALTANQTINLPNASGTVCLQGSAACGFATGTGQAFLQGGNSFGTTALLGTNDNNPLQLEANGHVGLTLLQGGNVGIGTSTPAANLDVMGSGASFAGTGTVAGTAGTGLVTGTGTSFTTQLQPGDTVVTSSGIALMVGVIFSDTSFNMANGIAIPSNFSGLSFTYTQPVSRILATPQQTGLVITQAAGQYSNPLSIFSNTGGYLFTVGTSGSVVASGTIQSNLGFFQGAGTTTFQSQNRPTGNSGNVVVDAGTATAGTTGSVNIGTTNASAVNIGITGSVTTVNSLLGVNIANPQAQFQVQAPAGTSSGTTTMTATNGTASFTTSSSVTLNRGDYVVSATTGQGATVATTATGTSFTTTTIFTANVTGEKFTVYHPTANITGSTGVSQFMVQGGTGNVIVGNSFGSNDSLVFRVGGTAGISGNLWVPTITNPVASANSFIQLSNNGTVITRNVADSNAVLTVQNLNASSTGDILDVVTASGFMPIRIDKAGGFRSLGILANSFGGGAQLGTILTVNSGSASDIALAVMGSAGQSANLLNIQNSAGNIQSSFNSSGNVLTLGNNTGAGTSQGQLVFTDGTADGYGLTLQSAALGGNAVITIPNTGGVADTVCLHTLGNCVTGGGGGGGTITGSGAVNYVARWTTSSNLSTGTLYDNGTFVGIGTTTNSGMLSIQGGVATQPSLSVTSTAGNAAAILQGGNVGIGTATPAAQLDVEGTGIARTGTGTISSAANIITGVGTSFLSQLHSGDVIIAGGQTVTIQTVVSNTNLTVSGLGFSPNVSGAPFTYTQPTQKIVSGTNQSGLVLQASSATPNYLMEGFNSAGQYVFYVSNTGVLAASSSIISNTGTFSSQAAVGNSVTGSLRSGAVAAGSPAGSTSGAVWLQSGSATAVAGTNSGNVYVDSGSALGTPGTVNIGTVNASTTTVGNAVGTLSLQGGPASALAIGSGANTTTLLFAVPSGTNTITFPAATGTVCLQGSAACGFMPAGGGSGYVQLDPASAQTDATTASSIFINKTSTGNLLQLQQGGNDQFVVGNTGTVTVGSTTAGTIQSASGQNLILQAQGVGTVRLGTNGGTNGLVVNSLNTVSLGTAISGSRLVLASIGGGTPNDGANLRVLAGTHQDSITAASGVAVLNATNGFEQNTLIASNANVTTTNAPTVYIQGATKAGTNQTITNSYGLQIDTASVAGAGTVQNAYGLSVQAPTGATNNYAAIFQGGNVGIGTNAPAAQLDVEGSGVAQTGTGTISSSGGAITGVGTSFLTQLHNGDVVTAAGQTFNIGNITSNTSMNVLTNSLVPALSNASFTFVQPSQRIVSSNQIGLVLQVANGNQNPLMVFSKAGGYLFYVNPSGSTYSAGNVQSNTGIFNSPNGVTLSLLSGGGATSGAVLLQSSAASAGNSGSITIDSGTATGGTTGTVNIGVQNASAVNIGSANAGISIQGSGAASGTVLQSFQVAGDSNARLTVSAGGTIAFGTGSAAPDVTIGHGLTPYTIAVGGGLYVQGNAQATGTFVAQGIASVGGGGLAAGQQLRVQPTASTNIGVVIKGAAGQSANLMQLQDSAGNINGAFDGSGSKLSLGNASGSTQGKIVLSDGTGDGFAATIQTGTLTGNRAYQLPDSPGNATDTICLQLANNCGGVKQGGNAFGTTMTLGTTDNNALNFITNSNAVLTLGTNGAATFKNSGNSTAGFQIQDAGGTSLFNVDTQNDIVTIGPSGGSAGGTILVVGTKTTAGDPTGVDGAIYYNAVLNKFRCFENGSWFDCISRSNNTLKSADENFAATSYANVGDLSFPVDISHTYSLQCSLLVSVTGSGGNLSMTGPAGASRYVATFMKTSDQGSGDAMTTSNSFDDPNIASNFRVSTSVTGSNMFIMDYRAVLANGSTAGIWQLRAKAAAGSSSFTIYKGSTCSLNTIQ